MRAKRTIDSTAQKALEKKKKGLRDRITYFGGAVHAYRIALENLQKTHDDADKELATMLAELKELDQK